MEQQTAAETMHGLEEGDKIELDTHNQIFTVTNVMFDGEMLDIEGPRGGEKGLVENVNSGRVAVTNGGRNEGTVTEINVR
jgi:predicted flavoprotein YhiN